MNCPSCGNEDYYFGMLGHSCINSDCIHFDLKAKTTLKTEKKVCDDGDSAPYIENESGQRILTDHQGNQILCQGKPYEVSIHYPDVVGCKVKNGAWFACHYKNSGVGTDSGAHKYWEYGDSFTEAIENYINKWNFRYE